MNTAIPLRKLRPTNYGAAFEKMKQHKDLTPEEIKLRDALQNVESDTLWGEAIRDWFIDQDVMKFRQLYQELLSQNDDNDLIMLKILGQPAYSLLLALKPKI